MNLFCFPCLSELLFKIIILVTEIGPGIFYFIYFLVSVVSLDKLPIAWCLLSPQMCTGNYTFVPYMVTPHNKVYCCDSSFMKGLTELMQPNFELLLGPICLPLVDRFVQLLKVAQASSR